MQRRNGTLELVIPFISNNKPSEFARSDLNHKQGRDENWLQRLVHLLFSLREEAQLPAAFHFAMETKNQSHSYRIEITTSRNLYLSK